MVTESIAVYDMAKFESKLQGLNKKAVKIGMTPITYKVVGVIEERDAIYNELIIIGTAVEITYQDIVQLPGDWKLIAVLDHTENLIRTLPDEYLPQMYRDRGNVCDHCKSNRQRNETFVVLDMDEDEYYQVGRTCLGDFLGINPTDALGQIDFVKELKLDDEGLLGSRRPSAIKLVSYLTDVSAIIRKYGWISGQRAKENGSKSTAMLSWQLYFNDLEDRNQQKVVIDRTEYDAELAQNVADWMNSLQDRYNLDEYLVNLSRIAENDYVTRQSIGFAASAISAYQREMEKNVVKSGAHLGDVGDKIEVTVTLLRANGYETQYGWQHTYVFSDTDGNTIVWKTAKTDYELNRTYQMRAKVKKHNIYNGDAQTEVTHANLQ